MPIETILALIAIALLANLALIAVSPGPVGDRVRSIRDRGHRTSAAGVPVLSEPDLGTDNGGITDEPVSGRRVRPVALERVTRVGTWVFLFAATVFVAVTDIWGDRQGPILAVLATAAIVDLVLREVVRRWVPEIPVLVAEGAIGMLFAGLLVGLSGGATSPFFFAFPLLVVGAAIVVTPGVTLTLTAGAGAAYVAAVVVGGPFPLSATGLATVGVNLTALCLLAYVGMAVGREQRRVQQEVVRRATIDELTGLRTRSYLFGVLERELARSQRTGRSFCLLMLDLDDLKGINDRHGHLHGDRALRTVGEVIRAGIRRIDTGSRFGGDEFVVLLPETDPTGGWVLAEKIRQGVSEAGITVEGAQVQTSVSVGLVAFPEQGVTIRELLERADAAMYRAKRAGRDQVTGVPVMDADTADTTTAGDTTPAGGRRRPV